MNNLPLLILLFNTVDSRKIKPLYPLLPPLARKSIAAIDAFNNCDDSTKQYSRNELIDVCCTLTGNNAILPILRLLSHAQNSEISLQTPDGILEIIKCISPELAQKLPDPSVIMLMQNLFNQHDEDDIKTVDMSGDSVDFLRKHIFGHNCIA